MEDHREYKDIVKENNYTGHTETVIRIDYRFEVADDWGDRFELVTVAARFEAKELGFNPKVNHSDSYWEFNNDCRYLPDTDKNFVVIDDSGDSDELEVHLHAYFRESFLTEGGFDVDKEFRKRYTKNERVRHIRFIFREKAEQLLKRAEWVINRQRRALYEAIGADYDQR